VTDCTTKTDSTTKGTSMDFGYENARVVVAGGGGGGMGASVVEQLSGLGAEIHVLDLKEPPVEVASHHAVDLRDPDAVAGVIDGISGPIDKLFNCQGIGGPQFTDVDVMLVNFLSHRHLASLCAPQMTDGGAICGTSSVAGVQWASHIERWKPLAATETFAAGKAWIEGHPEEIAGGYVPSKQAIIIWTKFAAFDFAQQGIRVNCISPGTTRTPMTLGLQETPGVGNDANFAAVGMGRWAEAVEQAWPMIFLNSALASYVTGENIDVDGGTVAGLATGRIDAGFDFSAHDDG
jgi:NAD(P)-dependent dehydrogenase (short-subunit alcohol dehydrogenase family)